MLHSHHQSSNNEKENVMVYRVFHFSDIAFLYLDLFGNVCNLISCSNPVSSVD